MDIKQTVFTLIGIVVVLALLGHVKGAVECSNKGGQYMKNYWGFYKCVQVIK